MSLSGWIGVDLDGTLAHYDGWIGISHIGEPVPAMLERVKKWITEDREVRIFTARVSGKDWEEARYYIQKWCKLHIGMELQVTNCKDFAMIELYDDRCVQVETNTGRIYTEKE